MRKIRIGIDVGGTFTHAVAIDNSSLEIVASAVSPTTHDASAGVAEGVVRVFSMIKEKLSDEDSIIFVAHSTTQATNALLEGDVAKVGIIAAGSGVEGLKTRIDADIPPIEVAENKSISTCFEYAEKDSGFEEKVSDAVRRLKDKGCGCIAAAEAFSVDDPANEIFMKEKAAAEGVPACGTYEMSGLYGLRARTKTAVINASILPKMTETADMTEKGLAGTGSDAALMVMRSDGGVMTVSEMRKKPLLTLLSGPAAGIAAALSYVRATDAVFLETGGTSTDITAIKEGRASSKSAVIGGHSTYMKTLDCRTVGIAGGSMFVFKDGKAVAAGPRSAHIAGLEYLSFADPLRLSSLKPVSLSPFEGDPGYLALENDKGERFALTLTCAALYAGYIKPGDYAFGKTESAEKGFKALEESFGRPAREIAMDMLSKASEPVIKTVRELMSDYGFGERKAVLIGGGGGSSAVLPFVAERLGMDFSISEHSEVISAIGAAMAMIRETIEKNIFNPSPSDIEAVKREALEAVIKMGAVPESADVFVEIDSAKNIVRASASGSIEFKTQDLASAMDPKKADEAVIDYFKSSKDDIELLGANDFFRIYSVVKKEKKFFGLFTSKKTIVAAADSKGSVRRQVPSGGYREATGKDASSVRALILDDCREYGDAGAVTKGFIMIAGHKMFDYTSAGSEESIISLSDRDLKDFGDEEKIFFIAVR